MEFVALCLAVDVLVALCSQSFKTLFMIEVKDKEAVALRINPIVFDTEADSARLAINCLV
jgi:hypothetical protein